MKCTTTRIGQLAVTFSLLLLLENNWATASPHPPLYHTDGQRSQKRIPMRINSPPRIAPDNQTALERAQ